MARKRGVKRRKSSPQKRGAQAASTADMTMARAVRSGKTELPGARRVTVRPVLATSVVAAIIVLIAVVSIWTG